MFQAFSILILIVAIFSLINHKWIKLPNTIALMIMGIIMALLITLSKFFSTSFYDFFCQMILDVNFKDLLFDGILSFLLFAGALHVDYKLLFKQRKFIFSFSTISVIISTGIVALLLFYGAKLVGLDFDLIECLLFGALISPTDPVAALAILKKTNVSKDIKVKIEGESLFNDGIGVIVFSGILLWYNTASSSVENNLGFEIFNLFLEEVVGGVVYGLAIGYIGYRLIKWCKDSIELQIMLSLSIAMSGYAIAQMFHFSGPLALVIAGLIIGNRMHLNSPDSSSKTFFNQFWEILDDILNGLLFLMIGLSIHLVHFEFNYILLMVLAIVMVLISRFVSVIIPFSILKGKTSEKGTVPLLTWSGLRGGISLGLAISLPETESKNIIVLLTFIVVAFSIIVQGLTISSLAKQLGL